MFDLTTIARWIMLAGALLLLVGGLLWLAARFGIPLGRLPGDLRFGDESFRIYVPITTLVLINVVLWVIVWIVRQILNR